MLEYDELQEKITDLENENSHLLAELQSTKKDLGFWMEKSADLIPVASKAKPHFRTALFSCYLGGVFSGFLLLKDSIFQASNFFDFLKLYGGLVLCGALGLAGIGFIAFGVSHFFFEEKNLPRWFWMLLFLITPLFVFFFIFW